MAPASSSGDSTAARYQKILAKLLNEDDNKYCCDCDAKGPRWASWNLGLFVCIRCAGIHRNLGVHISKVKSVNLDSWTTEQMESMLRMGNRKARAIYEANLPPGHRRPQEDFTLEQFIRNKYEKKLYADNQLLKDTMFDKVDIEKYQEQMAGQKPKPKTTGPLPKPAQVERSTCKNSPKTAGPVSKPEAPSPRPPPAAAAAVDDLLMLGDAPTHAPTTAPTQSSTPAPHTAPSQPKPQPPPPPSNDDLQGLVFTSSGGEDPFKSSAESGAGEDLFAGATPASFSAPESATNGADSTSSDVPKFKTKESILSLYSQSGSSNLSGSASGNSGFNSSGGGGFQNQAGAGMFGGYQAPAPGSNPFGSPAAPVPQQNFNSFNQYSSPQQGGFGSQQQSSPYSFQQQQPGSFSGQQHPGSFCGQQQQQPGSFGQPGGFNSFTSGSGGNMMAFAQQNLAQLDLNRSHSPQFSSQSYPQWSQQPGGNPYAQGVSGGSLYPGMGSYPTPSGAGGQFGPPGAFQPQGQMGSFGGTAPPGQQPVKQPVWPAI